MILIGLVGPKVNPEAFALAKEMYKVKLCILAIIIATVLILVAVYAKIR